VRELLLRENLILRAEKKINLALPAAESVLSDHEDFSEQLLAVPEEEEVLSEEETCHL